MGSMLPYIAAPWIRHGYDHAVTAVLRIFFAGRFCIMVTEAGKPSRN